MRATGGAPSEADLLAYFQAIARETTLPLVLYLNPGPGADVSVATTIALAKLDRVVMVKESSRDLARIFRLIVEIEHAGHARYLTTMQAVLITLMLGGGGVSLPPPAAEIAGRIVRAFNTGDYQQAAAIELQFALFPGRWAHRGVTATMKAAMDLIGQPLGRRSRHSRHWRKRRSRRWERCFQRVFWRRGSRPMLIARLSPSEARILIDGASVRAAEIGVPYASPSSTMRVR